MKHILNIRKSLNAYTKWRFFYAERGYLLINKMRRWLWKYRYHLLIWLLFIIYENMVVIAVYGIYARPLTYITHYSIIISLFYFHANLALPRATKAKKASYFNIPFVIVFEVAVYVTICFGDDLLLTKWHILPGDVLSLDHQYISRNLYRGLYFIGFSSGYYYIMTYLKEKKRSEDLERQKLNEIIKRQQVEQELTRSQNAFLKAQINPHFLFNTLDFIYHHISGLTPVAADAIIALSEMMRFAIDADKMGELITIGEEMEQVNNLVYLSRLRKDEAADFRLIYNEQVKAVRFIPLVLLTLSENIFKHGQLNKGNYASLSVYLAEGDLYIETDNKAGRTRNRISQGTGLTNIEKRLRHMYGNQVYFQYNTDDEGRFKVLLRVTMAVDKVAPPQ